MENKFIHYSFYSSGVEIQHKVISLLQRIIVNNRNGICSVAPAVFECELFVSGRNTEADWTVFIGAFRLTWSLIISDIHFFANIGQISNINI